MTDIKTASISKNISNAETVSFLIRVYGIVQGVGFRPTVNRHAISSGIKGTVCNKGSYVEIIAQGKPAECDSFIGLLRTLPPKRAEIIRLTAEIIDAPETYDSFSIIGSSPTDGDIYISPDIAICEDCRRELFDKSNRRYLHPFINCTNCGPRMTILEGLPYDRERTSMNAFPMCAACSHEYHDPSDRRYDAQPVCCNKCGPEVYILNKKNIHGIRDNHDRTLYGNNATCASESIIELNCSSESRHTKKTEEFKEIEAICGREAITMTRRVIASGGIAAIKGIGGFHLCCNALDPDAVTLLRKRKRRMTKPFAVMMRDLGTIRRECQTSAKAEEIITGHKKPILLLPKKPGGLIPDIVAPDNQKLGVMLPYAPVQLLLFDYNDDVRMPDSLIMTSANDSGAPICRNDDDALRELGDLCDIILSNNRMIRIQADDTVMELYDDRPYMIRRSRGYAPLPFLVSQALKNENVSQVPENENVSRSLKNENVSQAPENENECGSVHGCFDDTVSLSKTDSHISVLGIGGELKNSFCIAKNDLFYLSPYVGDLEDIRTCDTMSETLSRFSSMLETTPSIIVCDTHPLYHSRAMAHELSEKYGAKLYEIQHHYAHILSCMAENDFPDPVIGISFDGTGYGNDGKIWGGEILLADTTGFKRAGTICEFSQAGGDASAREGWRIAVSMLLSSYGEDRAREISEMLKLCDRQEFTVLSAMITRNINCIGSTSAGRLFDAVSAVLGIRRVSDYEGDAATSLMCAAERYLSENAGQKPSDSADPYSFSDKLAASAARKYLRPVSAAGHETSEALDNYHIEDGSAVIPPVKNPIMANAAEELRNNKSLEPYLIKDGLAIMNTAGLFRLITELKLEGTKSDDELSYIFHALLGEIIVRTLVGLREKTQIPNDKTDIKVSPKSEDQTNKSDGDILEIADSAHGSRDDFLPKTATSSGDATLTHLPETVCLSGGVFQNLLLLAIVKRGLEAAGFNVLIHSLVPPNDGGIALGQALYGMRAYNRQKPY